MKNVSAKKACLEGMLCGVGIFAAYILFAHFWYYILGGQMFVTISDTAAVNGIPFVAVEALAVIISGVLTFLLTRKKLSCRCLLFILVAVLTYILCVSAEAALIVSLPNPLHPFFLALNTFDSIIYAVLFPIGALIGGILGFLLSRSKKLFKIVLLVLIIALLLYMTLCFAAIFGWRLFGFDKCDNPDVLSVNTVFVTDESVCIDGEILSSISRYVGYKYIIKDDIMYLGIKHNIFAFVSKYGNYCFTINDDIKNIKAIYLSGQNEEKCVWTLDKDGKYMEKNKNVRLYETVHAENGTDYKAKIQNAEFKCADEDLLNRLRHPAFSDDFYISKGNYVGVAELQNGEEMILIMHNGLDYYKIEGKRGNYNY